MLDNHVTVDGRKSIRCQEIVKRKLYDDASRQDHRYLTLISTEAVSIIFSHTIYLLKLIKVMKQFLFGLRSWPKLQKVYILLHKPIHCCMNLFTLVLKAWRSYSSGKMDWGNLFQSWDVRVKKLLDRLTVRLRSSWTLYLVEAEAARVALRKTFISFWNTHGQHWAATAYTCTTLSIWNCIGYEMTLPLVKVHSSPQNMTPKTITSMRLVSVSEIERVACDHFVWSSHSVWLHVSI